MKKVYSEADQEIISAQEQILEEFDHAFFKKCSEAQMTGYQACGALMSSEERNAMLKNIIDVRAKMVPSTIMDDDC